MLGGNLFSIVSASLGLGFLPQRLVAAERQQALYTWQLSQLLSAAAPAQKTAP